MPTEGHRIIRERAAELCRQHIERGLGDRNTTQRLCSPDEATYWQQLSEILIADQLVNVGQQLSHPKAGPDFLLEFDGRRIWIEVICPTPAGIPREWLQKSTGVGRFPHEEILLRWTAAIKEKSEKLIGKANQHGTGYIEKGMVAADDVYVIAINGRLLRHLFPALSGISQWPFAVEATFCVGPLAITLDRETAAIKGSGHQHRAEIPKPNGSQVPADTFLDPRFKPVSAIWALDIDDGVFFNRGGPMEVIHNPLALNRLPRNLLPAQFEHVAYGEDNHYVLERHPGLLSDDPSPLS